MFKIYERRNSALLANIRFLINQYLVNEHIKEIRELLKTFCSYFGYKRVSRIIIERIGYYREKFIIIQIQRFHSFLQIKLLMFKIYERCNSAPLANIRFCINQYFLNKHGKKLQNCYKLFALFRYKIASRIIIEIIRYY